MPEADLGGHGVGGIRIAQGGHQDRPGRVAQIEDQEPGCPRRHVRHLPRHGEPGRAGHGQGDGLHHLGRGRITDVDDLERPQGGPQSRW